MSFSKYALFALLTASVIAGFWVCGRKAFTALTQWLLWALAALCLGAGAMTFLSADGSPLAILGGFALWLFAGYSIRVAKALHKGV